MFIEVVAAKYLHDYLILIEFNDGVTKRVNLEKELVGKVLEPLRDPFLFKSFKVRYNTIEWENGADFAPEFLYEIGEDVMMTS